MTYSITVMSTQKFEETFMEVYDENLRRISHMMNSTNKIMSRSYLDMSDLLVESIDSAVDGACVPHRHCAYLLLTLERVKSSEEAIKEYPYIADSINKIINFLSGVDDRYVGTHIGSDGWGYHMITIEDEKLA